MSTKPTPDSDAIFQRCLKFRGSDLAAEFHADVMKLERERDALRAEVERLKEWEAVARRLAAFAKHKSKCLGAYGGICDCGRDEAKAAFDALAGK